MRARVAVVLSALALMPVASMGQPGTPTISVSGHFALATGRPFSSVETVTLRTVEVSAAFRVVTERRWTLDVPVALVPVALVLRNPVDSVWTRDGRWWVFSPKRATSHGVGVRPIGVRFTRSLGVAALHVGLGVGVLRFDRATPGANSRRLNMLGDLDIGLRLPIRGRFAGVLGYRFSHISNANTGAVNPGIDSHMRSIGIQR